MWCSTDDSEGGSFVKPSVSNDWKEAAKSELVSGSGDIWMAAIGRERGSSIDSDYLALV